MSRSHHILGWIYCGLLVLPFCGCSLFKAQVGSATKPAGVVEAPASGPYVDAKADIKAPINGRIGTIDRKDHSGSVVNTKEGDVTIKSGGSCWPVTIVACVGLYLIGLHQKQPRYFHALKRRTFQ